MHDLERENCQRDLGFLVAVFMIYLAIVIFGW